MANEKVKITDQKIEEEKIEIDPKEKQEIDDIVL